MDSAANAVGRLAVDGSSFQSFPVPTASSGLQDITAGPDGNLWFVETSANKVGRITTSGAITEFPMPATFHYVIPVLVASGSVFPGPDGNVWISGGNQMARVTPQGSVTVVSVPSPSGTQSLTIGKCVVGPDQNFWCTSADIHTSDYISKITTSGAATTYPSQGQAFDLIQAADGNIWFVSQMGLAEQPLMTRLTPAGVETVYSLPFPNYVSEGLASGADGNIWFTQRATTGVLWQLVLSSATDDGHATFNSATISSSLPEGIIPVTLPSGAAGIRPELIGPTESCPEYAFIVTAPSAYSSNVTLIKTARSQTCTDLTAVAFGERISFLTQKAHKTLWGCEDRYYSHDPAVAAQVDVRFPLFTTVSSVAPNGWDSCTTSTPQGKGPIVTCTATEIEPDDGAVAQIEADYEGLDPVIVICSSQTPDTHISDNVKTIYSLDTILEPVPPPSAPPASVRTRR